VESLSETIGGKARLSGANHFKAKQLLLTRISIRKLQLIQRQVDDLSSIISLA
jgi:hypothetical protein